MTPGRRPARAARALRGFNVGLFGVSAVFNAVVTVPNAAEVFEAFRDMAWLGGYRDMIDVIALANPTAFALLLVVFEVMVAVLLASRTRWVRVGVAAAVAFELALIPALAWPYYLPEFLLVALQLPLVAYRFEPLWRGGERRAIGSLR